MRKALTLGPVTRMLAYDAARLFALGMQRRPELKADLLSCLTRAVELGHNPGMFERELLFQSIKDDDAFKKIVAMKPGPFPVSLELQLLDPLP